MYETLVVGLDAESALMVSYHVGSWC